jgi:serine/threonine protein kinase/Tfp pilus assembly protein PilF
MIGKTISHYQILEKLGEGGMGEVFKAKDIKLERTVALKFLPPHFTKDEEIKKRFEREAKAAASLNHPNLITIYDISEFEGQSYIIMEYVEGHALRSELEKGPMPLGRVIDITAQICKGLYRAHNAEIVHRDIKPANVMITQQDEVKILDFGLALLTGRTRLTRRGTTFGTIAYMSPEQHRGEKVDQTSDIWSVGVVLYEMTTGQLPFKGEHEQAIIYSICNESPESILTVRKNIPEKLDEIITKALQKKPDARYHNINEMIKDLKSIGRKSQKSRKTRDSLTINGKESSEIERIGNYKILESIGEGGMGTVYLAEQTEPFHRRVAIKIIKLGMDTHQVVARFDAERQALAVMDHPNIAKVYDAGKTETGRPYFVMEYVPGVPVTEYCDHHKLTIRQRLELFIGLCHAIQHAHQKGVIHRDLKPSNILITVPDDKPVPKIIDFGIAKAIGHRLTDLTLFTEQGQLIGTPEYMSPEQAEMSGLDVDTRTDIFSLGVVLYELSVGVLPYDPQTLRSASFNEIQRIICETDPPKASTRFSNLGDTQMTISVNRKTDSTSLVRQVKGDLDLITMKAMAKDRTQRYASASELATDVLRHLKHEPILASPPKTIYRLKKYIKRHKTGVAAAALIFFTLIAGITGTSVGLIKAIQAEKVAKSEAKTAQEISEFLQGLFLVSDPNEARGNTITAREILDKGAERIRTELTDQPVVQASLMNTIGVVYWRLGLYEEATSLLNDAVKIQRQVLGNKHLDISASLNTLAILYYTQGDYPQAEQLFREALSIRRTIQGGEHLDLAECLNNLAMTLKAMEKFSDAEPLYREALKIRRKHLGNENIQVAQSLNNFGKFLYDRGNYDEAEPILRESLSMNRKLLGQEHPEISANLSNLALVLYAKGEYEEAESMFQEVLAMDRKFFGENHPYVASTLNNLGTLLLAMKEYQMAEIAFLEALNIERKTFPESHWKVAMTKSLLGSCYTCTGRYIEAEKLLLGSYQIIKNQFSEHSGRTKMALERIITLYEEWNKPKKIAEYRANSP